MSHFYFSSLKSEWTSEYIVLILWNNVSFVFEGFLRLYIKISISCINSEGKLLKKKLNVEISADISYGVRMRVMLLGKLRGWLTRAVCLHIIDKLVFFEGIEMGCKMRLGLKVFWSENKVKMSSKWEISLII